ncbi:MAG TPA: molybdenum ABC transporter ATP-binding protein [Steroidobacteraceae bacterium]
MTLAVHVALARAAFALEANCEIPTRGITGVFGRSGGGKTTLLRCIAGLERTARGRIEFDGVLWQDATKFVPAHRRGIGYVFQESNLFAHLDVRGNLEYGLRRVPPAQRRMQLEEAIALLDLSRLLHRRARQLSGGESQRVAIARALLASPRLLLMDEPLSSLDRSSKAEILPHVERLRDHSAIPIIYVSHALSELVRLADHLLLLEAGRVQAAGPLQQLLARAELAPGAPDHGGCVFEAVVEQHDAAFHLSYVRIGAGRLAMPLVPMPVGARMRVRIDAHDVSLAMAPPGLSSLLNVLPAQVLELLADRDPGHALVRLQVGAELLLARITRLAASQLELAPGTALHAQIRSVAPADQ